MKSEGDQTKAVRLTPDDMAVVSAVQRRLGLRSCAEVLRMGLRSLAREQGLVVNQPEQQKQSA